MLLIAHQQGHKVTGAGVVQEFLTLGTHTRTVYSHRRVRRPQRLMAVLVWMFS